MPKTKHEVVIENWRGHGRLVIPKGQPVSPTSHNQYFVESFGNLFDKNSIGYHDATYYGIRVNAEDIEPPTKNLQPVNPLPAFLVVCVNCGRHVYSNQEKVFADLNGEPFKAYYCESCAKAVQQ